MLLFSLQVYTEMYSMPNGEQDHEGEASRGESGDWKSNDKDGEESEDSSDGEEVDSPPRTERRSKQTHDPMSICGKAVAQTLKHTRTSSPVSTEKAPKQPKIAAPKPWKTLPKINIDVPITSG